MEVQTLRADGKPRYVVDMNLMREGVPRLPLGFRSGFGGCGFFGKGIQCKASAEHEKSHEAFFLASKTGLSLACVDSLRLQVRRI